MLTNGNLRLKMKKKTLLGLCVSLCESVWSQPAQVGVPAIIDIAPDSRTWQPVNAANETNTFVELQAGLYYDDNGHWLESREVRCQCSFRATQSPVPGQREGDSLRGSLHLVRWARIICLLAGSWWYQAPGQGTPQTALVVDQGEPLGAINPDAAIVVGAGRGQAEQSFTPSLPAIGFVKFSTKNWFPVENTLWVNLHQGTYNGPVVGMSQPVALPATWNGYTTFFFGENIPVTSGQMYFLEPVLKDVDSGWMFKPSSYAYAYKGGYPVLNGVAITNATIGFWFQEGIVVPEVSITLTTSNVTQITWSSLTNGVYTVQRASNLALGFTNIAAMLATPPTNVYIDRSATNGGSYFYRIKVFE
ncbi:MAG: hypothetical protein ACYDH9_03410 [Limisphaerales bacterium]